MSKTHHQPEGNVVMSTTCWTFESREVTRKWIWEALFNANRQVLFL